MDSTDKIIRRCIDALNKEGLILFPTDTIIGLGCDASSTKSVNKLIELKKRTSNKGFIVLVSNFDMLINYVEEVPDSVIKLLDDATSPLSIIYPKGKNLSKNVLGEDGSIAIRIVKTGFAHALITKYNKAIVATSVNLSGSSAKYGLNEVPEAILSGLDYVVNLPPQSVNTPKASTIIKLNSEGKIVIIRE